MANDFPGDAKTIDLSGCDLELCNITPFTREDMEKYPFSIDFYPLTKELMDWIDANGGIMKVLCGK